MPITALYAALLTPLLIFLSVRVIKARRGASVAIGDGGNPALMRAMRVQANFTEYVPLALILMALAESLQSPALALHALGVALVVGRSIHAYGVSQVSETINIRVAGMVTTFTVLGCLALLCLAGAISQLV
ncbi:MAG: MAPEG family protein [Hyphomicrobium sp.]|nr:MAPEG family protein [Hyphomicrobium sp.]